MSSPSHNPYQDCPINPANAHGHCTLSDLGQLASGKGFIVGLILIIIVVCIVKKVLTSNHSKW